MNSLWEILTLKDLKIYRSLVFVCMEKEGKMTQVLGPVHPHARPAGSSRLLASAWPTPTSLLGSKPMSEPSVSEWVRTACGTFPARPREGARGCQRPTKAAMQGLRPKSARPPPCSARATSKAVQLANTFNNQQQEKPASVLWRVRPS